MLFYSGIRRTASDIADDLVKHIQEKERQLRLTRQLVDASIAVLNSREDIRRFGELLDDAWRIKRELSDKISNRVVDDLYEAAKSAGAVGGKLTGAGGGGFLLLFVPPALQGKVQERFRSLIQVPFRFEHSGSQIIFFEREEDFASIERIRNGQAIQPFRELEDARGIAGPEDL
jgi:D-glycero-alpha-D-manno-heptose-7-phosphate kinase